MIVPALFAMVGPTLLAATAHSLSALIFWRFLQGLFGGSIGTVLPAWFWRAGGWGRLRSAVLRRQSGHPGSG